ncbi:UDP-N-acetylglucosamine 2-epimerase (hydrolyzing) [Candidatus Dependentiae bacterium]|nr:UDP-N-acetylglucosamine 2-epimerase (hydrolyzing) [Candidatus Dependentiae bacterium]
MKKKICVITGSRAEYGLFYPLLKEIKEDDFFELQIIVTGMHLSPEFGLTYKEILKDGFAINEKVEMLLSSDTEVSIAKSTGLGIIGFSEALNRLKPDAIAVLGDRFEIFSAVAASVFLKIPVIHIHGGELTEGAFDDQLRHAITKMSVLHFTSCEEYKKRVIQLGEDPENVFNCGALGVDNIFNIKLLNKKQIEKKIGLDLTKPTILATYHPVTLENNTSEKQFRTMLKVIDELKNYNIIFTKPNADTDGRIIIKIIDDYVNKNSCRAKSFISLGTLNYLSILRYVKFVIGNSSSGIIEVPYFNIPTVNIGDRQKGRVRPDTVIDCSTDYNDIKNAVIKAVSVDFIKICMRSKKIYGEGNSSEKIASIIKKKLEEGLRLKKQFYDMI